MSEDFGYSEWLVSKSRRGSKQYQTGHSYKCKKVDIVGRKNNEYIEIFDKNPRLERIEVKACHEKFRNVSINVPLNCVISVDKKRNEILNDFFSYNGLTADENMLRNNEKGGYDCLKFDNEQCKYQVNYKVNKNFEKDVEVKETMKRSSKSVKINKNKVRREKKSAKSIDKKEEEAELIDTRLWDYKFTDHVHKKTKKETQEIQFRNVRARCKSVVIQTEDEVFYKDRSMKSVEMPVGNYTTLLIGGRRSYIDKETAVKELKKELSVGEIKVISEENTCEICCSTVHSLIFPAECQHRACIQCWENYLKSEISSNMMHINRIKCLNCDSDLSVDFLASFLPEREISKLKESFVEFKLRISAKYVICLNQKCDRIILINKDSQISVCQCNFMICNKCHKEAHYPASCDETKNYERNIHSEIYKTSMYVPGKRCPSCDVPIEKSTGCSSMRCVCGYGFCWECLSSSSHYGACSKNAKIQNFEIQYYDSPLFGKLAIFVKLSKEIKDLQAVIGPRINQIVQSIIVQDTNSRQILYDYMMHVIVCFEQAVSFCKHLIIKYIAMGIQHDHRLNRLVESINKWWAALKEALERFKLTRNVRYILKVQHNLRTQFASVQCNFSLTNK